MSPKKQPKAPGHSASEEGTLSDMPFETAIGEIERIVDQIESGEIGLDASLERYERGAGLVRHCRALLSRAEQRIEELDRHMASNDAEAADSDAEPAPD